MGEKIETILSIFNTLIYRRKLGDYELLNTIAKIYYEFKETENGISFIVEGNEDAQITVGLSEDTEYQVKVKGEAIGMMKTNLGGKLVLSVELAEEDEVEVEITR